MRVNPFVLTLNSKKKRPVPDDVLYNARADLRTLVARGNCILRVWKTGAAQSEDTYALMGMRKFTGKSEFDDDDTSPTAGGDADEADEAARSALAANVAVSTTRSVGIMATNAAPCVGTLIASVADGTLALTAATRMYTVSLSVERVSSALPTRI